MTIAAPNWHDEIEFEAEVFQVSPVVDCSDTIARTTGKWTIHILWLEWVRPELVKERVDGFIADGWTVEEFSAPSKPQEEIDLFNTTITARKRTAP